MAILQEKLDNETIVNERLLRESMKHNYSSINRYLSLESTIFLPLIIIVFPIFVLIFHLSWWPVISIMLLCVGDVIFDYKVNHIKDEAFMADDLVPTALRLQRAKRLNTIQMMVSMPLIILLIAWFLFDFFQSIDYQDEPAHRFCLRWHRRRLHRTGLRSHLRHPTLSQTAKDASAGHRPDTGPPWKDAGGLVPIALKPN